MSTSFTWTRANEQRDVGKPACANTDNARHVRTNDGSCTELLSPSAATPPTSRCATNALKSSFNDGLLSLRLPHQSRLCTPTSATTTPSMVTSALCTAYAKPGLFCGKHGGPNTSSA